MVDGGQRVVSWSELRVLLPRSGRCRFIVLTDIICWNKTIAIFTLQAGECEGDKNSILISLHRATTLCLEPMIAHIAQRAVAEVECALYIQRTISYRSIIEGETNERSIALPRNFHADGLLIADADNLV